MMKVLITALLSTLALFANASDMNCAGKVTVVMDYPSYCGDGLAFMTTGSGGGWICSPSEKGNALLLTALVTDKILSVYMNNNNGALTCSTYSNYAPARYIILNK